MAIVVGLAVLDAVAGPERVVITTVVVGPLLAGLRCSARQTTVVAALAALAALLSGLWTQDASSPEHLARELVVFTGAALAVVGARQRERADAARRDLEGLLRENAGLSSELAVVERRFGTALDAMAAAVLIQRPGEGIVYANQAAADAMGLPSAAAVLEATPEEIAGDWDSFDADGERLTADQYPSRRILTGLDATPEPLISRGLHRATGRQIWLATKATRVPDEDGDGFMAVSVSEDITAVKRAELVQRFYARAGEALASSLDVDETLRRLAQLVVPELADWCVIGLRGDGDHVRQVAVAHRDPEKTAFAETYHERFPTRMDAPAGAAAILRGGPSMLTAEVPEALLEASIPDPEQLAAMRIIGMRSVIQVPIVAPAAPPLGVLSMVSAESRRVFTAEDLATAEEIGRRAGVALQNGLLYTERAEIAATLQDSLLPDALPQIPGMGLAASYRAAGRSTWVGGDFYDAFQTPRGWVLVVGDVAGHGAEAAALTAQARHSLRSAAMLTGDLVVAVGHLNAVLSARRRLSLCTVCAVLLPDAEEPEAPAEIVCAGHPLPVCVRAGEAEEVGAWGAMIGAFPDMTWTAVEVPLLPGDVLVLYTDGVLDARGAAARFGNERLRSALAPVTSAEEAVGAVERALEAFETGSRGDDTAVLAVDRPR